MPEATGVEALRQELNSLQTLTRALLVAIFWLGAGTGWFVYRQVNASQQQVAQQKQMVARFEKDYRPGLDRVVATLQAFAKTNKDFMPYLAKYDFAPAAPAPAPYQGQKK